MLPLSQDPDSIPNNLPKQPVCVKYSKTDPLEHHEVYILSKKINDAYSTVVHQRKSVYLFPSGSIAKLVIEEITRLWYCWTYTTKQDSIMINALLILPIMLLQKASFNSKSKENAETSKRRLSRWKDGQIAELLFKGQTLSREDFIKTTIKYLMKIRKHTE